MRLTILALLCGCALMWSAGCTVYTSPAPVVETQGPVVEGPGVEVIEVEPPPVERVYIYDPGYPPGTYFYHGYYYYGGYRYDREVFVHRYVEVNVREHRYVDVEANRREGHRMEETHRAEYARTGGVRESRPREQVRPEQHEMSRQQRPVQRQARPEQQRPQPRPQQREPRQQGGRNEQ